MKQEDFIHIPKNIMKPIKDYNSETMLLFLKAWTKAKTELYIEKDRQYGGSWQTDGFLSAYYNLKRKIDRVIQRFTNGNLWDFKSDSTGESTVDTFMDLENYSAMNAAFLFLSANSQEAFDAFTAKVPELDIVFLFSKVTKSVEVRENRSYSKPESVLFTYSDINTRLFKKIGDGAHVDVVLKEFKTFCMSKSKKNHLKNK